jgi:uncharacterized protein (DUF302 family)
MKRLVLGAVLAMAMISGQVSASLAEDKKDAMATYMGVVKKMQMQTGGWKKNTFMGSIGADAKKQMVQSLMSMSPIGMREIINMMATKVKVNDGISFDDVIESMKTRANGVNMKMVGHNVPYKLIRQIEGHEKSPRIEILSFCDMLTMRHIVDVMPEFVVFLPCRITVMEDAEGKIWITTMDWSVDWLKSKSGKTKFLDDKMVKLATKVNIAIKSIMQAGKEGDF